MQIITAPIRQHELDHTDHTDQESYLPCLADVDHDVVIIHTDHTDHTDHLSDHDLLKIR